MYIEDIIWLPHIVDKLLWKHHVTPFAALGQTNTGRKLIVFFVYKLNKEALLISARDMTKKEKKQYEGR